MSYSRTTRIAGLCLAALLASQPILADPGNGKNKQGNAEQGKSGHNQTDGGKQNGNKASNKHANGDNDSYERDDDYVRQHYDADIDSISRIFSQHRGQYGDVEALPPGIRKNLARGKPLPPGIAKKFDGDLGRQLPRYPGYEWQRLGTDAALVDITTGVVREVMRDVLQ